MAAMAATGTNATYGPGQLCAASRMESSERKGQGLLVRRVDYNPPIWLAFSTVIIAEHRGNLITALIGDPQINIRRKFVHDFDINFAVADIVPEQVLRRLANSPNVWAAKTQCVERHYLLLGDRIDEQRKLAVTLTGILRSRWIAFLFAFFA